MITKVGSGYSNNLVFGSGKNRKKSNKVKILSFPSDEYNRSRNYPLYRTGSESDYQKNSSIFDLMYSFNKLLDKISNGLSLSEYNFESFIHEWHKVSDATDLFVNNQLNYIIGLSDEFIQLKDDFYYFTDKKRFIGTNNENFNFLKDCVEVNERTFSNGKTKFDLLAFLDTDSLDDDDEFAIVRNLGESVSLYDASISAAGDTISASSIIAYQIKDGRISSIDFYDSPIIKFPFGESNPNNCMIKARRFVSYDILHDSIKETMYHDNYLVKFKNGLPVKSFSDVALDMTKEGTRKFMAPWEQTFNSSGTKSQSYKYSNYQKI